MELLSLFEYLLSNSQESAKSSTQACLSLHADCVSHRDQNAKTQHLVFHHGYLLFCMLIVFNQALSKNKLAINALSTKDFCVHPKSSTHPPLPGAILFKHSSLNYRDRGCTQKLFTQERENRSKTLFCDTQKL